MNIIKLWVRLTVSLIIMTLFVNRIGASQRASTEEKRGLIEAGEKYSLPNQILWDGIGEGNANIVQKALQQGACTESGILEEAPLYYAINYGHIEIVKMLVLASHEKYVKKWENLSREPEMQEAIASMMSIKAELGEQDWVFEEVLLELQLPKDIKRIVGEYVNFNDDENTKKYIIAQIIRNKTLIRKKNKLFKRNGNKKSRCNKCRQCVCQ